MKAAQISKYGETDVIQITADAARPKPGADQVLVQVRAVSLNPVDIAIRAGHMHQMAPVSFPGTLGGDFAGVIADVGSGANGFTKGDEVYGQASLLLGGSGTLAEFAAAAAKFTARKPKNTDFAAAASLPLVGASAYQAIAEHLNVQRGQKILIHGAAGGVGSIAVRIAKHLGAYVIATAFADDIAKLKSLGVDEVIDAGKEKFETRVRDVDGVLDLVRGDTAERSYAVIKRGGTLVSLTAQQDEKRSKETGVKMISQFTQPTTERLDKLRELVEKGIVTPNVGKKFPLEKAAEAFRHMETDKPAGKVVVTVA